MKLKAAQIFATYSKMEIHENAPVRGPRQTTTLYESREWSSPNQMFDAIAEVLECAHELDNEELATVAEAVRELRSDQMGRDGLIWY